MEVDPPTRETTRKVNHPNAGDKGGKRKHNRCRGSGKGDHFITASPDKKVSLKSNHHCTAD